MPYIARLSVPTLPTSALHQVSRLPLPILVFVRTIIGLSEKKSILFSGLPQKRRPMVLRSQQTDALNFVNLFYKKQKRGQKWFNALGRSTPFGGTKFGLICSIFNTHKNVKQQLPLKSPAGRQKLPALLTLLTRYLQMCFGGNEKNPCNRVVTGIFLWLPTGFVVSFQSF